MVSKEYFLKEQNRHELTLHVSYEVTIGHGLQWHQMAPLSFKRL